MQFRLHPEELLLLALKHPFHGNAGPLGDDFRDILGRHGLRHDRVLDCSLPGRQLINLFLRRGDLAVAQFGHFAVIARPFGRLRLNLIVVDLLTGRLQPVDDLFLFVPSRHQGRTFLLEVLQLRFDLLHLDPDAFAANGLPLDLELADPAVKIGDGLRDGIHLQAQLGGRLIDEINRLIRKETARNVSVAEIDGSDERIVLNLDLVMVLVFLLEAAEDRDRLCRRRFVDRHDLEPPLQGLVGLEVFLVLIQRRGADGPQFTPGQGRLKDVGGIHGA